MRTKKMNLILLLAILSGPGLSYADNVTPLQCYPSSPLPPYMKVGVKEYFSYLCTNTANFAVGKATPIMTGTVEYTVGTCSGGSFGTSPGSSCLIAGYYTFQKVGPQSVGLFLSYSTPGHAASTFSGGQNTIMKTIVQ